MTGPFKPISLMLVGAILYTFTFAVPSNHGRPGFGHLHLAARDQSNPTTTTTTSAGFAVSPCSDSTCVTSNRPPVIDLPCTDVNDTIITAGINNQNWTMLCDIDFFAQDIFPFILAGTFEECLKHCDDYNQDNNDDQCAGFVFAPDRVNLENDCYLKSSVDYAISPSTIHLVAATLLPQLASTASSTTIPTNSANHGKASTDDTETLVVPVIQAEFLGISTNTPTKQYVDHAPALPMKLASTLLKPGINIDLITKYPLATDTGSWQAANLPYDFELTNLTTPPTFSRDGGKGGNINGTHVFYFCDTSTFGDVEGPLGFMNGFVSSSAAVDVSRNGLSGKALELEAPIGQWQDDVGRLRGWIPMTAGEEAFNIAVSGDGYRYAVWPESSFIPLNETHSALYASIVYVEVDMQTQAAQFTSVGNTLIVITIDPVFGPYADRVATQLFTESEVQWGSLGGLRAWGNDGRGHDDGMVYLFGHVDQGILMAKVPPTEIADRSAYVFWNGTGWSPQMQDKDSTAFLIKQPVMDFDIVWSPTWNTVFIFYLTPFADNTFYMRWLKTHSIIPPYLPGGSEDWAEGLHNYNWSDPWPMFKPDTPAEGFIYAGACHFGYFGADDFANGGIKLLVTWTEHTEKNASDPASGYAHKSVVLTMH